MALVCGLTTFRSVVLLLSAPSVVVVSSSANINGLVADQDVVALITGCVGRPCKGLPCEVSASLYFFWFVFLSGLICPKKVQQAFGLATYLSKTR